MKVFVTGCSGFIGFHLCQALLDNGCQILGLDNMNNYYDIELKKKRLDRLLSHKNASNFNFVKEDLQNLDKLVDIFAKNKFDIVINLAAQAGVRYSLDNPQTYIESNISGFVNLLEVCKDKKINHFIFASSSSVYGQNKQTKFSVEDKTDFPISLYAATKKSNEIIAHSYSHLYSIPITGLRFFTVYGPYGRPDMAYYKFVKAIMNNEEISVFNNGAMERDFTYIDDVIKSIRLIMGSPPKPNSSEHTHSNAPFKLFNIGNNNPVNLNEFIKIIEDCCGKKAIKNFLPMQPGDVTKTYANIDDLVNEFQFKPEVKIDEGLKEFVNWYRDYSS